MSESALNMQAIQAMELYVPQASIDFLWTQMDRAGEGLVREPAFFASMSVCAQ